MKEYSINIAKDDKQYYILDFTITRPIVGTAESVQEASIFAKGYKAGIEIDSNLKFQPTIKEVEKTQNIKQYIKDKKKYYDELWKSQN